MQSETRFSSRSFVGALAAVAVLSVVVGCTPDVKDLRAQGVDQFRSRQYVESMATLTEVLAQAPSDAQGNYYMGLNYRALAARKFREDNVAAACRDLDTAVVYFTQAVKSWPNYMEAVASKNEALEARGKYAEALALAEGVAHVNRGDVPDHFIYLGNEYRERGDYDNALRAYKIALASDPGSARAYANMGKLYERIGDLDLARDALSRAYELDGSDPGIAEELARLGTDSDVHPAVHQSPK